MRSPRSRRQRRHIVPRIASRQRQRVRNGSWTRAVERQVRTAFGPLRIAKISVDDREFRSNVDAQTFEKQPLTVVRREEDGSLTEDKQIRSFVLRAIWQPAPVPGADYVEGKKTAAEGTSSVRIRTCA